MFMQILADVSQAPLEQLTSFGVAGPTIYYPSMGISSGIDVSGRLFVDNDGNGEYSPGDRPLFGYTIYIDADNDGVLDDGETRTEFTPGMFFHLSAVPPGKWVLRFVPPADKPPMVEPRRFVINVSREGLEPGELLILWLPTTPTS